jgi:disulfide bond formation protein DsbB
MDTATVTLFFALLAVVAQVAVVAAVVLAVGGRWSPGLRRMRERLVAELGPQALGLAAAVAAVCTAGSLYLSEVAHFPPCRLCWYQRGAMYPLIVVLGVAAWTRSRAIRAVALAIAAVGAATSSYHMLVERYPTLETSSCDPANPCSIIWVEELGYLTIPTMALSGFVLIIALVAIARPAGPTAAQEAP